MKAYCLVLLLLFPYSVTRGDGDEQFRVKRQGFRLNLGSRSLLSGLSDVLGQFAKPKQNDKLSETTTELPDYDYSEYRNDYEEETSDSTNKTLQDVVQQLIKIARDVYPIPSGRSTLINLNAHPSERFQFCRTPKNEPGHCRYIQHCLLPEFVTDFSKFVSYVCFINSRYVGACCPDDHPAENIPGALTTTTIPEVLPPIQDEQDKPFRPHRPERPSRRPGRPNRRPGRPFQPGRPNRPGRPFRPGRPNRPGRPFRPGRPNRPGRPLRPNGPERPYEPEEPEPTPPTQPPTTTPKPTQPPPPPSPEPSNSPYEEVCGLSFRTRIVGGKQADPGDWLWMAALIRGPADLTGQFCGGALINRHYVLTAAHCTEGFTANTIKVRLGEYDFSKTDDNSPTDVAVAEIKSHPNFDKVRYYNDIALLRLENPVTYSDFIRPICLPDPRNDLRSKVATVIGWGTLAYGGASSNVLQEVDIPVWDNKECNKTFVQKITKVFLCAGSKNGDKDSCQGDSGGPLMLEGPNRRWTLIGIVSWGIRCAEPNYPGVYTRVTEFLDWIRENISE